MLGKGGGKPRKEEKSVIKEKEKSRDRSQKAKGRMPIRKPPLT